MSNPRKIFSGIYDQYIEKIYRFIFLKVSSQETAQDLTSETFLRGLEAFQKSQSPNPGEMKIENMQAFLYQIARNLVTDFYREKGKTQLVSAENMRIIDPRENLEEKAEFNSDLEQIKANLASLKEDHQEVIILHYLNDLSIKEIAQTLNKPEGTIRVMIHRGLKELRGNLTDSL
jgi:RNA polymerase sigma-70 factor (ECF subfamily)